MRRLGEVAFVAAGLLVLTSIPELTSLFIRSLAPLECASAVTLSLAALPLVLAVFTSAALIWGRRQWSARLFPEDVPIGVIEPRVLLRVTLVAGGLFMIASSITEAVVFAGSLYATAAVMREAGEGSLISMGGMNWGAIAAPFLSGAFGVLLLVKARQWSDRLITDDALETVPASVVLPSCPNCGLEYDPADYRADALQRCSRCEQPLSDA